LETDAGLLTSGDAIISRRPDAIDGIHWQFAFLVGLGHERTLAEVGRFTADGSQNLNTVFVDLMMRVHYPTRRNPTTPTYQIDTVDTGSGRGTMTFTTTNANLGQFNFVFYLISRRKASFRTPARRRRRRSFEAQTGGPFTATSVAGNYAVSWTGVNLGSTHNVVFEEDSRPICASASSGQQHNGAIDVSNWFEREESHSAGSRQLNVEYAGTGRKATRSTTSDRRRTAADFKFKAYFVNQQRSTCSAMCRVRSTWVWRPNSTNTRAGNPPASETTPAIQWPAFLF